MTTHKLNKKAIAVTGLPDDAYDFDVKTLSAMFDSHFIMTYKTPHRWETFGKLNYDWDTRSEKPMTVLGRAAALSEDDWKRVVLQMFDEKGIDGILFADYTAPSDPFPFIARFKTAAESGHSLLKSKGLYVSNPFTKPVEDEYMPSENFTKKQQDEYWQAHREWQSAQLLTNPLILIIE